VRRTQGPRLGWSLLRQLRRRPGKEAQKSKNVGMNSGWLAALFFIAIVVGSNVELGADSPRESLSCLAGQLWTRDLDKAYDDLEKAQRVNDEYGLAELTQHDLAFLILEGTRGLVIDSDFLNISFPIGKSHSRRAVHGKGSVD
jgi:hypothetical protein